MLQCAICLNDVRTTRTNSPIRCGHMFHSHCLEEWKSKGKHTCPLCRKVFDVSQFKVTITVQNNYTATSNTVSLENDAIFNIMDIFDMSFDVENTVDLESLFADLGMSLSDLDSLVLDTE
jgi:hypothetical protein